MRIGRMGMVRIIGIQNKKNPIAPKIE